MARFLRDPGNHPPPEGVESRRLKVYQKLVYNNIEGFIRGGFPVLRSLYDDAGWHALVRAFIDDHRCHTPYFLEISQEFLQFLLQDYQCRPGDPPFLAELAHYEWVELALDIAEEELPPEVAVPSVLSAIPRLSPLAWSLSYHFPVHRIGPSFRPVDSLQPTYLVVYRNRADEIRFMELNATTARLMELVRENEVATGQALLVHLAGELGLDVESILAAGEEQLTELIGLSVILVSES